MEQTKFRWTGGPSLESNLDLKYVTPTSGNVEARVGPGQNAFKQSAANEGAETERPKYHNVENVGGGIGFGGKAREYKTLIESINAKIGQTIPGEGVLLGLCAPLNRNNHRVGKTYEVYAAPQDLTDDDGSRIFQNFRSAAEQVSGIKNLFGHDGWKVKSDIEQMDAKLLREIKEDKYKGEWVIPTRNALDGICLDGTKVWNRNLLDNIHTGDLEGTFTTSSLERGGTLYASCTGPLELRSNVIVVDFSNRKATGINKRNRPLCVRPIRYKEVVIPTLPPSPT